jgi:hypothetical protein
MAVMKITSKFSLTRFLSTLYPKVPSTSMDLTSDKSKIF